MIPKLAILGLLSKKNMHGYEIIKTINTDMTNFCDVKVGSIYFAMKALSKSGEIEIKETIKGKEEPDKIIYSITKKGREEFEKLLRKAILKTYAGRYPIDIAIHFKDTLPEKEFRKIISDKLYISERVLKTIQDMNEKEQNSVSKKIFEHQILHQKAEIEWLNNLL
ncbi:MAG: PadR family transcriptional regulator [Candidatus Woesearchaeota archaeon]|jgi:DNA-binding PadR family transcriptional regulator